MNSVKVFADHDPTTYTTKYSLLSPPTKQTAPVPIEIQPNYIAFVKNHVQVLSNNKIDYLRFMTLFTIFISPLEKVLLLTLTDTISYSLNNFVLNNMTLIESNNDCNSEFTKTCP